MALSHGLPKGHTLGTGADGVGGIFDIGAGDVGAELGEQDGADTKLAVGAVRRVLGSNGMSLQVMQLLCSQTEDFTRRLEVLVVDAGEEGWCSGGHPGCECAMRLRMQTVEQCQGKSDGKRDLRLLRCIR